MLHKLHLTSIPSCKWQTGEEKDNQNREMLFFKNMNMCERWNSSLTWIIKCQFFMKGNLGPLRREEPTSQFLPPNDPSSFQNLFEELIFSQEFASRASRRDTKKIKETKGCNRMAFSPLLGCTAVKMEMLSSYQLEY